MSKLRSPCLGSQKNLTCPHSQGFKKAVLGWSLTKFTFEDFSHDFSIFYSRMLDSKNSIKSNKNVMEYVFPSLISIKQSANFPHTFAFFSKRYIVEPSSVLFGEKQIFATDPARVPSLSIATQVESIKTKPFFKSNFTVCIIIPICDDSPCIYKVRFIFIFYKILCGATASEVWIFFATPTAIDVSLARK